MAKKIALITLSTRTPRIGPDVTAFVEDIYTPLATAKSHALTTIDLKDYNLPLFDEKLLPAMVPANGQFEHEHSKNWSAAISPYDGYIIVAPEYNHNMAGATKNAIDFLYHEWIGKPIVIVTYGIFGGSNASESLKKTLNGMKLKVVETRPQLAFHGHQGPSLTAAVGGQLDDATKEQWKADTASLVNAYEELTTLLETAVATQDVQA